MRSTPAALTASLLVLATLAGCTDVTGGGGSADRAWATCAVSQDVGGQTRVTVLGRAYGHPVLDPARCIAPVHNGGALWLYLDHEQGVAGRVVDISPDMRMGQASELNIPMVAAPGESPEAADTRRSFLLLCQALSGMKSPVFRLMDTRAGFFVEPRWRRIYVHDAGDLAKCTDLKSPPKPYVIDINYTRKTLSLTMPDQPLPPRLSPEETTWPNRDEFYREYKADVLAHDRFGGSTRHDSGGSRNIATTAFSTNWSKTSFGFERPDMSWEGERGPGVAWEGNRQVEKALNFSVGILGEKFAHPAYKVSPGFIPLHGEKDWYLYVEEGASPQVLVIEHGAKTLSRMSLSATNPSDGIGVLVADLCQMEDPSVEIVSHSRMPDGKLASMSLLWRGLWRGPRLAFDFNLRSYVVDLDFASQSVRCREIGPTIDLKYMVQGEKHEIPWDLRVKKDTGR